MASSSFYVTLEESHAILRKVLPLMSEQQVPTIPENYTVWYDYVSGTNDGLALEIKRMVDDGDLFSPEACRSIYERFYLEEIRSEVDGIQDAVREAVQTVLGELGELGEDIGHFSSVLDEAGESLKREPTPEDLNQLIMKLAQETRRTRERSLEVEGSLQGMASELTELRAKVNALSRDSVTDALTGIANRRAFDEALARLSEEATEEQWDLCLILADIDHFKAFNDTHGHLVGDRVLRFVAQEMAQCVKGKDVLCRYGGEEFAILLPATPYTGAIMLAESIRAIIEAQVVDTAEGEEIDNVTISLGVSQLSSGETTTTFIERADDCLYQSKDQGRNRVTGERDLDQRARQAE